MNTYNFTRRLKTLNGLTPYEYICKIWTSEPDRFILSPIHQMLRLNTFSLQIASMTALMSRPCLGEPMGERPLRAVDSFEISELEQHSL